MDPEITPRISSSAVSSYAGRVVLIAGNITSLNVESNFIEIKCSDGGSIQVDIGMTALPALEQNAIVEAVVSIGSDMHMTLQTITLFPDAPVDWNVFNEAVALTHRFPDIFG
ncbi:uncharacterized protein BJ171DRAFT_525022 [Polychytrium aggregatum]|uniref:uncharacterized protein n=1 Tax=Polychytrium aggregatum TaxID=110093 RepID=UPI0022FF07F7|nr:uncharacterized protein BJ171DRAFT_525022 [Polychytrium aggregatum]KAI9193552.1 hypothetical protein BJ171DRAFT_525022 [Polychytrium aggregatum]